ncbi:MAG: bifunctional riboflavin kinase/FAD synthetase [Deltaproteobacteria bacterium]
MEVVRGHRDALAWERAVVVIGNFDGVHLGHRALIERAKVLAAGHDAITVVLTFDPHPSTVFSPATAPKQLTTMTRKLELLAAAGADVTVVEPFTRELANSAPHAFVDDVVLHGLRASAIVVGYDFSYGAGRMGTTDALRAHGARAGVEVDVVPAVEVVGEVASSTRIRLHLREGNLAAAERLLARHWDVDGIVGHGAKRGRTIGVPTANITPHGDLPIAGGIYAVTLRVDGTDLPAVASLGTNPTFVEAGPATLEVHVLDWQGDLYDREVRTTFVARLRDEAKFDGIDALVAQIHADIAAARRLL